MKQIRFLGSLCQHIGDVCKTVRTSRPLLTNRPTGPFRRLCLVVHVGDQKTNRLSVCCTVDRNDKRAAGKQTLRDRKSGLNERVWQKKQSR